jgi:peptidyl-Lys metalloendopeptidase
MFVKPSWILAGLAGAAISVQAAPLSKLDVRLSVATPVVRGDVDVLVDVTVTNPLRHAVAVPESTLPTADPEAKLFSITRDGQPVRYQGAIVKRMPAQPNEMVVLQPGASLSYQVELTGAYDLSQDGRYSVEYVGLAKHGGAGASTAPLYLWLEGRSAKAAPAALTVSAAGISYTGNCSASQQNTIVGAVSAATTYAQGALSYLSAYGQTAAKALAVSDPAKALDNADSHEYFAENTPAQP